MEGFSGGTTQICLNNASLKAYNINELSSSEEESEESDTELDDDEDSEDDLVIADLDEQSTVRMPVLTFVPDDQVAEVTVQANTG